MFQHNLKIALRNMRRYKNQTLISIIGLAVGFTCFALATLWIRYEMSYDSFHKNAKHLYVVYRPNISSFSGFTRHTTYPLAAYLKETFPEVSNATSLNPAFQQGTVTVEGVESPALTISADSLFLKMFDVKILEGSRDFLIPRSNNIAITREKARQLFGNEDPIGKEVTIGTVFTICAIVSDMPKRSNYAFDFIRAGNQLERWLSSGEHTIIELFPGINLEAFEKKLYEHDTGSDRANYKNMVIEPLTKIRYTDANISREVKFQHIVVFSISGLLVILCSLFNYLTLFVCRFRMRQKELALRMVCGASGISLLVLLSVEFLLTMLFAVILGGMLTQLAYKPFMSLSDIQMGLPAVYFESLIYIGSIILVSLLVFWLILIIFQRRSINVSIRRSNKKLFRKASVVVQLIISVGFAFCTIVILKQMHFLHNSADLGFSFQNRGSITVIRADSEVLANQLKQIPEITEVVLAMSTMELLPSRGRMSRVINSWDERPADAENTSVSK